MTLPVAISRAAKSEVVRGDSSRGFGARAVGFHRQNGLAALQSLHLTFLIHAKHNGAGLFRRVEVKATMSRTFSTKNGSLESLKVFSGEAGGEGLQMRLMVLWESRPPEHQPGAPLGGRFGLLFQSLCNHRFDLAVGDSRGAPLRGASPSSRCLGDIARRTCHRWRADSRGGCHLPVIHARSHARMMPHVEPPLAGLRARAINSSFSRSACFNFSVGLGRPLGIPPCYHPSTL